MITLKALRTKRESTSSQSLPQPLEWAIEIDKTTPSSSTEKKKKIPTYKTYPPKKALE